MAPAERRTLRRIHGDAVETAALAHLQAHGLRLLSRNAAAPGGEIGIVAVADGEQEEAERIEISLAVVGDVPAEAALADLREIRGPRLHLFGREIGEGRHDVAE